MAQNIQGSSTVKKQWKLAGAGAVCNSWMESMKKGLNKNAEETVRGCLAKPVCICVDMCVAIGLVCSRCQLKEEAQRRRHGGRRQLLLWSVFVLFVQAALCGPLLMRPAEVVNNELGKR